tara:strand:+ start:2146 stop:9000 length:6855 start_codon:yes stop_codon:yes gene_type:complete
MKSLVVLSDTKSHAGVCDLVARTTWYLAPYREKISKIHILSEQTDEFDVFQLPEIYDPALTALVAEMLPQFTFESLSTLGNAQKKIIVDEAEAVFLASASKRKTSDPLLAKMVAAAKEKGVLFEVDPKKTRMEGSFYLWAGLKLFDDATALAEENRHRFEEFKSSLSPKRRAYVFGTGPSLSGFAASHDFSDGHCIVSNSMVKNADLLAQLKPVAIVAADPIFHAGCSRYAGAFRTELIQALRTHACYFITSLRDYNVFHAFLPEDLRSRLIGVPFDGKAPFNPDLSKNFSVQPLANILTLLLFPVAGTITGEICVVGCDGRPLDQNTYFWGHDKSTQFNDEMENIKLVHPAFFAVDYDDYYSEHCKNVALAVDALENLDKTVQSLTPSYIPALAARGPESPVPRTVDALIDTTDYGDTPHIVLLDPDGKNASGHFLAYDRRIWESASTLPQKVTVLGRLDFEAEAAPAGLEIKKCFTVHSWQIASRNDGTRARLTLKFISELREGLIQIVKDDSRRTILYLYCGSLEHVYAIQTVLKNFPNVCANVNLFWQSTATYKVTSYVNRWRPLIAEFAGNAQIYLTVPTQRVGRDVEKYFGLKLQVAPHPSTTFSDAAAAELASSPKRSRPERPVVLFPGGVRTEKGFGLTVEVAELLKGATDLTLRIRANEDNSQSAAMELLENLRETTAETVDGYMTEDAFSQFLSNADVIVCPYLPSHFAARTSGLVIDAMILGQPVVALKDTWLGDFIEQEGFGIAAEPNGASIAAAIRQVVSDYATFASHAAKARNAYLLTNSWARLVQSISEDTLARANPENTVKEKATEADRKAAVAELPSNLRSAIFLPTDRIPLAEQINGIKKVAELYRGTLTDDYGPKLRALKAARRKKRCFIIGNGPSLKKTDLTLLKREDTFVTNGFFLKLPELTWVPKYYVVEDHLVAEDRAHEINLLRGFNKLFPASLRYILKPDEDTIYFDHRPRKSFPHGFDFSFDADENTFAGGTVTFTCMELAAYLGYEEIYLIGVDASYAIPKDAEVSGGGRVKEIDMASDDPNHFHPDYFGKGKRWHEPNVNVMIQAYEEAKRACDARGLPIVNATIGGELEVFPRTSYNALFGPKRKTVRTLIIDMTLIGDATATGELKAALFKGWPENEILQLFAAGEGRVGLFAQGQVEILEEPNGFDMIAIDAAIEAFQPEVILYRPTPQTLALHTVAMRLIDQLGLPLVTWIMDDWPADYIRSNPKRGAKLDADWHALIERSSARLSISQSMSEAFGARYGFAFTPIANGIRRSDWPTATRRAANGALKIRYAGSLAENMTLDTVKLVSQAVEDLAADGTDVTFEIKTRERWRDTLQSHFSDAVRTSFIVTDLSPKEYRAWLSEADVVVIAYNFDDVSKSYTRHSLANKLPECLASGAALLAVGPADIATMSVLEEIDCGMHVNENQQHQVAEALRKLAGSADERYRLAEKAQKVASEKFNIKTGREQLANELTRAGSNPAAADNTGRPRTVGAHVDETAVVARLLSNRRGRDHILLDVGAHFGTSSSYFDKLGWTIYCFEPDPNNRIRLQDKYATSANVTIDPRAVSDKPATGVSFFTSDESTGISGLLAFRDTHTASATVDLTTVSEIIADKDLNRIDFLKIDVEGYDLNVLKGVPWDKIMPEVIECEFEDAKTLKLGHTWKEVAEYLRKRGYTVYLSEWHPIVRYGIPHDWRRILAYPGPEMAPDAWGNILAFREDPGYEAVAAAFKALVALRTKPTSSISAKSLKKSKSTPPAIKDNGIPMLKKTPPSALPAPVPSQQKPTWYVNFAKRIHETSPRLYGLMRFVRRAGVHLVSRPMLLLPFLLVAAATLIGLVVPQFAAYRPWIVVAAFGGMFAAALAYVAFRSQAHAETLHVQMAAMRAETAMLRDRLSSAQMLIAKGTKQATTEYVRDTIKNSITPKFNALNTKVSSVGAKVDTLKSDLSKTQTAIKENQKDIQTRIVNRTNKVAEAVDVATKKAQSATARSVQTEKWSRPDNAHWYQFFNRRLTANHIEILETEWRKRLSIPVSKAVLGYMATRACEIERQLEGRLATSVEDVILRSLVGRAVKGQSIDVLEIGTLFGTGAAVMYDVLHGHYEQIHFTLLDPLEGYYNASQDDILTGQRIDEKTLRRNLEKVGMSEDQYTLIKSLSTDPAAIKSAGERQYDVLVIDADHSYAGVKTDFENYAQWVKLGGYIIFDDYGSPDWPDVQEYVDSELADVDYISRVGVSWRTCVYRVVKSPTPAGRKSATAKPRSRKVTSEVETDTAAPTE